MKRNFTIMIGAVIGVLCLSTALKGQSKDEKISVTISKEEDGERKTFEKTYSSLEEMKEDKEYQAFADEETNVWVNFNKDLDEEIEVRINGEKEGGYTISTGDDQDIHVMNLSSLADDMSEIEVEIKKVIKEMNEESVESVRKIVRSIHLTDNEYNAKNRSNMNLSISDVSKGDFSKKSMTNSANKLDEDKLIIKVVSDQLVIKYPISETAETKISLYDKEDEVLFISRIAENSKDLRQQIDLSQHPSGNYWLEVQIDEKRTTKKINIKREE